MYRSSSSKSRTCERLSILTVFISVLFFLTLISLFIPASNEEVDADALISISDFGPNPTSLQMSLYIPTALLPSPAVVLALHGCSGSGAGYYQRTNFAPLSETHNFILIFPSSLHDNNCWDVASPKSLTHDGGGDSNGLANMIRYTIQKYGADPKKVFVVGTSSGAMMTNVLVATYPDLITAASAYSGVAAGCLAGSPGSSPTTADPSCAAGRISKTSAQWKEVVSNMYPGWNGRYPKLQVWHGTADRLVTYANLKEEIKEWEAVFGVRWDENRTSEPQEGYTKMVFGGGEDGRDEELFVAYSAVGVGHTVPVHEVVDLRWFGIL